MRHVLCLESEAVKGRRGLRGAVLDDLPALLCFGVLASAVKFIAPSPSSAFSI